MLAPGGERRVGGVVDLVELFEGPDEVKRWISTERYGSGNRGDLLSNGLDTKEVPTKGLDRVPPDKDKDVAILHILEGDGTSIGVDEPDEGDDDSGSGETFCSGGGGEVLGGVDALDGGVGESDCYHSSAVMCELRSHGFP